MLNPDWELATVMLSQSTSGYYNKEGQEGGGTSQAMGDPRQPVVCFKCIKK